MNSTGFLGGMRKNNRIDYVEWTRRSSLICRAASMPSATQRATEAPPLIKAPAGGIEPPIVSLTGSCLTVGPHRIMSVRTVGLEPTISCSRGTRNTRLSHVLIVESAQRESNPHIRLGKATGYRYIMGAFVWKPNCQRSRAPGGTRTHVAALRVRCPCR